MKKSRLSTYAVVLVLGSLSFAGCDTGIKCGDASGIWEVTAEIDLSACRVPDETRKHTFELMQNGCLVTIKGTEITGVMTRNNINWKPFSFPERGGTVTVEAAVSLTLGQGKSFWRWTDGTLSCTGTTVTTYSKK